MTSHRDKSVARARRRRERQMSKNEERGATNHGDWKACRVIPLAATRCAAVAASSARCPSSRRLVPSPSFPVASRLVAAAYETLIASSVVRPSRMTSPLSAVRDVITTSARSRARRVLLPATFDERRPLSWLMTRTCVGIDYLRKTSRFRLCKLIYRSLFTNLW